MLKRIFMIICSNSPSIQHNTQGGRQEMTSQPTKHPFQTLPFPWNSPPTVDKITRLVEKGQLQLWKPMKLSQLMKRIQLTCQTRRIKSKNGRNLSRSRCGGPDQRPAKQMRPGHFTNQTYPGWPGMSSPVTYPAKDTFVSLTFVQYFLQILESYFHPIQAL